MKRSKPLRADPEKTRAFLKRGRSELNRAGIKARTAKGSAAKSRVKALEGPLDPATWRGKVFAASGGTCVVSGARATDADDPRFHAHHPVTQDALRKRGLYGWLWDARNGMLVAEQVHMAHEHTGGEQRIAREFVPASVWEFCADLDALAGTSWATEHVRRKHPPAGRSRTPRARRQ
jgi:hypothetical protein